MPEVREEQIVIDAEEEAYLRQTFRRFALPYFGVLLALIAALGFTNFRDAPADDDVQPSPPSDELQRQIAVLEAAIDEVRSLAQNTKNAVRDLPAPVAAPTKTGTVEFDATPEWRALVARLNAMTTRVKQLEARPAERIVARSGAEPGDTGTTAALLDRMYNIETRREKEEAAARATQKSLLDRIYALESRADTAIAERTSLDQSTLGRLKNLEDRFFAVEQQLSDSLPAARRP